VPARPAGRLRGGGGHELRSWARPAAEFPPGQTSPDRRRPPPERPGAEENSVDGPERPVWSTPDPDLIQAARAGKRPSSPADGTAGESGVM